ncbi:MAG: serine O-acetyltransferase [Pseudomonadota bacterium]|nr:serine O-acetyltransferase [Pseudomonadota bacterium]MEC7238168.1 serine O-acetyltransferase [Pseudomonadota bacterium]
MFAKLNRDLNAILARDPAAGSKLAAMFLYPSFQVMLAYRIANPLWRVKFRFPARFIMQLARLFTGIEIHPGATIGCGFFVDHGSGVVIGETSIIGRNVTLYQGVTLGGVLPAVDSQAQRCTKRHPTLEDDVIVGSGAQILGDIKVGKGAKVGGNSVVTRDVPAGATVVGVPARQLAAKAKPAAEAESFAAYGVSHLDEVDPRARTIEALVAEVQTLRARLNDMEDRLSPTPLHDDAGKAAITDEDDLTLPPRKS